jgi:SAM-dependent methyltransferase
MRATPVHSTAYDNSGYWEKIHRDYAGQLRAVGHPWLSEKVNELKYASEAETVLRVLDTVRQSFAARDQIKALDVGTGTGYWLQLVDEWLAGLGVRTEISALDISAEALADIRTRFPHAQTLQHDLKTVDSSCYAETFDLVLASYCLHHLVHIDEFLNALRFVARSVKPGGFLLVMDPILTMPFSYSDTAEVSRLHGNGVPRHLYLLDDVLSTSGLKRIQIAPAVSFVLNGAIEANGRLGLACSRAIWRAIRQIGRSDALTRRFANVLRGVDGWLKANGLARSSSVCLYQK